MILPLILLNNHVMENHTLKNDYGIAILLQLIIQYDKAHKK